MMGTVARKGQFTSSKMADFAVHISRKAQVLALVVGIGCEFKPRTVALPALAQQGASCRAHCTGATRVASKKACCGLRVGKTVSLTDLSLCWSADFRWSFPSGRTTSQFVDASRVDGSYG